MNCTMVYVRGNVLRPPHGTTPAAVKSGLGFQHLPRDPANVNARNKHVRSLLLHKYNKYITNFGLISGIRQYIRPSASSVANMGENCFERKYTSRPKENDNLHNDLLFEAV